MITRARLRSRFLIWGAIDEVGDLLGAAHFGGVAVHGEPN